MVSVCTPTTTNQDEHIETLYQLDEVIRSVPAGGKLVILGDFNARIGSNHTAWADIVGQRGIGHENSNGKLLLSLCSQHDLSITNTFFQPKGAYKTTWMHPRSKHRHQTDSIICRKCDLRDFHITRAMRGAECSTDHFLLRSKVNLQVQRERRPQVKKSPKTGCVRKINNPDITLALQNEISKRLEQVAFTKGKTAEHTISASLLMLFSFETL